MRHRFCLPPASLSESSTYGLHTARAAATLVDSQALRLSVAPGMMLLLLSLLQSTLHAQQAPGQEWPQDTQNSQGYPSPEYGQPQPITQALTAEQLQQLVAPIALYPDTLVAQVLAAATYPAQVAGADRWVVSQGDASPDQIAAGADAQTWDPSVKALTAFPQQLAQMDRELQWTTDLGNAYYNQPQDVLETVQVMRQRAQAAGTLQNTPQEAVSYNLGYIQVAPVNPQTVYVPSYNPWNVYGQPVAPYQGFSLLDSLTSLGGSSPISYGLGIAMSAFNHTSFGWAGWALDWLSQSVLFHQSNYSSNSTSVAHWGLPSNGHRPWTERGRQQDAFDRTRFNQTRDGSREGFGRPATEYSRQALTRRPGRDAENFATNRSEESRNRYDRDEPGNYPRSGFRTYNGPRTPVPLTAREQADGRSGYGPSYYGGSPRTYPNRPAPAYRIPEQNWRASATVQQRGDSAGRSYLGERSYSTSAGRGFAESSTRPARSGGFHLFGGGHKSYGGGHAPKSYGGGRATGKGHSGGGGHSGGHHHDGGRHH